MSETWQSAHTPGSLDSPTLADSEDQGVTACACLQASVCGVSLSIPLQEVERIGEIPPIHSLPLAEPWALGVARVQDEAVVVLALCGPRSEGAKGVWLRCGTREARLVVVVDALLGLRPSRPGKVWAPPASWLVPSGWLREVEGGRETGCFLDVSALRRTLHG